MTGAGALPPLALAQALGAHAQALCQGLEDGSAGLYRQVTPVTAELLQWWFGDEACRGRAFNFHAGQRQAIVNVIVAHEVLASTDLPDLYRQVCSAALDDAERWAEIEQPKHGHPKYCLKMATGTGKTWVLQALLAWQLLNASAAREEGRIDPRFTRRFLVVAPGLIVYERLLEAFLGKELAGGGRDFATSDTARLADLFVPPGWREQVQRFVQGNACGKHEIGLKATGHGLLAISHWHLLQELGEELEASEQEDHDDGPDAASAHEVVRAALPVVPGRAAGNSLDALDGRARRGRALAFLQALPDLLVFNDEAHHIHEVRKGQDASEVEWQRSLTRIATGKGRRFVQVDFSATPYNDLAGRGRRGKRYFPHIVADFDLVAAMRQGLVKSLVLDKRREIGALPLEFAAERDADGNVRLSAGQRVMLRAGLHKLQQLEHDFARIDPQRRPKMLVVCEDTAVSPLVADFLHGEGLAEDEVLTVDSGRKAELGEKEWQPLRQRLFDLDRQARPRVVVSVLMLREGFDVANLCVIVPLRSTGAQILLEQTIGRGLRLMWREQEFAELKRENRERIDRGQAPANLLDTLSIIEHPRFEAFYDELAGAGLLGQTGEEALAGTGDLLVVDRRPDWQAYDFALPFPVDDTEQYLEHQPIAVGALPAYTARSRAELAGLLGLGDTFVSRDLQSSTLFGSYRVDGSVMNVSGYNEFLSRLTRRVAQMLSQPLPRGQRVADHAATPYLQTDTTALAAALDDYIRERLFDEPFEPFVQEHWRLLLLSPVLEHIVQVFGLALARAGTLRPHGQLRARHRRLSEVTQLTLREGSSMAVDKCIYPRLGWPAHGGGLERAFIQWCQADAGVQAFCKLSEHRHDFARLRYVRADGLAASYFPDFLVRTAQDVYLVETKAQTQLQHPDVLRKRKAAANWCQQVNALPAAERDGRPWHYTLVGEALFHEWRQDGARLEDLLAFCRVRPAPGAASQQAFALD